MDMLVPQMILDEEPPMASASEVFGSRFEKVAGSDCAVVLPFSSTKRRRRRLGVEPKMSEWMSPRRELFRPEAPGAADREERTNKPLELEGISGWRPPFWWAVLVGLELDA